MFSMLLVKIFLLSIVSIGETVHEISVSELIRTQIEVSATSSTIRIGEEIIYASGELPRFYEMRGYLPAWSKKGEMKPAVNLLLKCIEEAVDEGLNPDDYHLNRIKSLQQYIRKDEDKKRFSIPGVVADIDLLLTDAFLIYAAHLLAGRVDPVTIDPEWNAVVREGDMVAILGKALASGNIKEELEALLPSQKGYRLLKKLYARYREIAYKGGWSEISSEPSLPLKIGMTDERIGSLRERLALTDDLERMDTLNVDLFDESVKEALINFQHRHGLEADGILGEKTLRELNVSVNSRVDQIALNLERWRWLLQEMGDEFVLINLPDLKLFVYEGEKEILEMRAIVGRPYRRTPVFSDKITYLVINPFWYVPDNIAVEDILPEIKKNVNYLTQHNIKVLKDLGAEVESGSIDWAKVTRKNFRYRFRQDPGPKNALGRIKFMFPNKFNVYIHDTPAKDLFKQPEREFSSGCIRIEKPIELAVYLLWKNRGWNRESLLKEINRNVQKTVILKRQMPVHFLYWTAWTEEGDEVHFRRDIYQRDQALLSALKEKPPRGR